MNQGSREESAVSDLGQCGKGSAWHRLYNWGFNPFSQFCIFVLNAYIQIKSRDVHVRKAMLNYSMIHAVNTAVAEVCPQPDSQDKIISFITPASTVGETR